MTPLVFLYQDEFLVAIDKPAGMLVHPNGDGEDIEWIAMKRLRDQLGRRVFPVHRLDRPTSGVLLFALDKRTAGLVQQAFELRRVTKTYHAVVNGICPQTWKCDMPLQAGLEDKWLAAETEFERLGLLTEIAIIEGESISFSLLKVVPTTGRFHQIRRHLLAAGFPILGDFRYAGEQRSHALGEIFATGTRMLLQARILELRHPHDGRQLRIEAADDEDFLRVFPR